MESLFEFINQHNIGFLIPILVWFVSLGTVMKLFDGFYEKIEKDLSSDKKDDLGKWLAGKLGKPKIILSFIDVFKTIYGGKIIGFKPVAITTILSLVCMTTISILIWLTQLFNQDIETKSIVQPVILNLFSEPIIESSLDGMMEKLSDEWGYYRYIANIIIDNLSVIQTILLLQIFKKESKKWTLILIVILDFSLTYLIFDFITLMSFYTIMYDYTFIVSFSEYLNELPNLLKNLSVIINPNDYYPDYTSSLITTFLLSFAFYIYLLSRPVSRIINFFYKYFRDFLKLWDPETNPIGALRWTTYVSLTIIWVMVSITSQII